MSGPNGVTSSPGSPMGRTAGATWQASKDAVAKWQGAQSCEESTSKETGPKAARTSGPATASPTAIRNTPAEDVYRPTPPVETPDILTAGLRQIQFGPPLLLLPGVPLIPALAAMFSAKAEREALGRLAEHWDSIRGRDQVVSRDDLKKEAANTSNSKELRDAAQYSVDNEDRFDKLDTALKGGWADDKVSGGDLAARLKDSPLSKADENAVSTLADHWATVCDGDQQLSVDDLEKIAADTSQPRDLRDAAQHLVDNPDISRFVLDTGFDSDGKGKG